MFLIYFSKKDLVKDGNNVCVTAVFTDIRLLQSMFD